MFNLKFTKPMIFKDSVVNNERLIEFTEKGVLKAKSVLIFGSKPYTKGKLLCVFETTKKIYGFIIFKQYPYKLKNKYSSDFVYLNWRAAYKMGMKKFNEIKVH